MEARIIEIAKLEGAYRGVFDALDGLRADKQKIVQAGKLTPLGQTEAVAEKAMIGALPAARRARAAVEQIRADIRLRIDGLKLADADPLKEKQYAETRAMLLSKSPAERDKIVQANRGNPDFARAIASAPEYLSGVGGLVYQNIRNEQIEREHGEILAELRDLAEPLEVVERLADAAREETRNVLGVDKRIFEQIATVAERNRGELPFRVDVEKDIHGNPVEIPKVLDLTTGAWRRATGTEIEKSRTDSAAAAA